MKSFHITTRRGFLETSLRYGMAAALASLADIPLVMKKALAEPGLGRNNKKVLFIFLRGANDSLNSVVPIQDDGYGSIIRPTLYIRKDPGVDYGAANRGANIPELGRTATTPTYSYQSGIPLGNGFAALHPSLKFLVPAYNAGDVALVHRVGYPNQSRSHFDSQNYWETGKPGDKNSKDGIFYRAIYESGLAQTSPLTGVSVQSALPLMLRGSRAAMTNLNDPSRYGLLGIPNDTSGRRKADLAVRDSIGMPFPEKQNRDLLQLQYQNLTETMDIFASMNFTQNFLDNEKTDGDREYSLFPSSNATNGGGTAPKYVVDTGAYSFFNKLKAAAMILNNTDAIIAGTEFGGFDTHSNQSNATDPTAGSHPNLQKRIAWSIYALRKYFSAYANKCKWDDLVVVTLSEFGRTTIENSDRGTDHAEAGVMFVAGGAVKGYNKNASGRSGVFACGPNDPVPWVPGRQENVSTMFGASRRYLKRAVDYRSVLGELIRDHLGATPEQLARIIPGYASESTEHLRYGQLTGSTTPIMGELDLF